MSATKEKLRLDKYLWSIRMYKTRSQASEACEKGRVKMAGASVKASKSVNIGEEYDLKSEAKRWVIKVTGLLDHRVAYSEAIKYYTDLTPPEEIQGVHFQAETFNTGKRPSKIGRPTKKHRREIDGFMGEED